MFTTKSTEKNVNYRPSSKFCSKCGSVIGSEDLFCQSCGAELAVRKASSYVASSPRLESFKGYIQILGVVEIVFGVFALFIGLLLTAVIPLFYYLVQYEVVEFDTPMVPRLIPVISVLIFVIAVVCLVYAFVSILSGKRLLQYQNSGRIGTMVIGALNLFNFPFGTIFGIAALYILSQPEVVQLYTKY